MITYPPGSTRRGQHIFPECVSEHAFGGWFPTKGELHKLLQKGEYNLIGDAPIFEGTFVQVTKRGEFIGILNHPNIVILGILASTPTMLLPDLMIIARDKQHGDSKTRKLEIARLIPLELVEIYVHNLKERRLKIHMATGRNYYLQLCAPDGDEGVLFERWMRLIYLLHMATGKAKPPPNVPSKDVGLHTIWKTASMPSETQSWIPVIMDKGSSAELKKWSSHATPTRMEPKSKQSAVASKQSAPKSGALQPSSQQPPEIIQPQAYTSGEQPQDSVSKDPSKQKSWAATKQSELPMGSRPRRFSTCKPTSFSPPPSHASVAVETSEFATMSVGIGPSVPFTVSEAVGPSQPVSQLNAWASSQSRNTEQPGVLTADQAVISKDSIPTERGSWETEEVPVKLERSKKSRSLVEAKASQASQRNISQSRSNTPSLKKSVPEAQVTSRGSSRSARPLTQGGGGGLTSQSSSRKQTQMASRKASPRAPSASLAARSRMSAAVGSSEAYTKSVAVGPSEVGAVSVAAGPSQPASRASRVASARSTASKTLAFPVLQPASQVSRLTQTRNKASDNASARILETMNEEKDGAAGTGPISRDMSVKSRPSEKQGTSAAPSRLQSLGRTSAPYSQMAGMNEDAKGDVGSRPISREMSVKSRPSENQGTSEAPSRLQSQGRTSALYSQMAGMNEEPEGDVGSRPISREMSIKSRPSEKQGTSAAPSRLESQGRTSAPYSQMAGMNEEAEGDVGSRPISREMSVKSRPSEKQGTSAAPSRLQSQGRTSAPYSQMAGMNEEPKGDVGSRPISREMSVKSRPSEKQGTSAAPSRLQSQGRTSAPYSQMAGMNEEPEGDVGSRPISREMSVKSRPSEKQGTSVAPSRLQSPGRTSAPYSQMAGMNEEPEGDVGSRPISRDVSVKSRPSENQGTSAALSRLQSPGRTSAPYSQMAGMNEEAKGDVGSRPISREMSVKSRPSEKQGTSVAPSRLQSPGRTSAPYSQMVGMNEEPEGDVGSRPISREMSVKSRPSEKQGTSVAPSRLQSQGRTSAPYSQMAGMNEEPERDVGSRPISREMSVKSRPSENQGTSAAPSRLQSPGRTSAPYSQMAGMNEEPKGDVGSRPISREMSIKSRPSEKQGTSVAPSRLQSQGRTSPLYSQTRGLETQKLSKTKSSKPVMSPGPSQKPGRYTAPSPPGRTRKGWSQLSRRFVSVAAGPSEPGLKSVAVGPSQPFTGDQSRPQSRTLDPSRSVKMRTIFSRKKSKSGDKAQPSSATQKPEPLRDQASKSKSRLKNALSSAKQRSSLTFVTIYSVLSSSMERLRNAKSKEETKLQEEPLENISSKPSKHVTISGVIGPSGKSIQIEEPFISSEMNTLQADDVCSTTATQGSEPGNLSTPQSYTGSSQATVIARNMECSALPSKLDWPASNQTLPSSEPSEKSAPSNQASASTGVLPPKSKTSVDMGTSTEDAKPTAAGSFTSANWREQGQPSGQSWQPSKVEDDWTPSLQPSAEARSPERSRISVGVGRSVIETKSEAVGPSVRGSLRDVAVGPSVAGSWKQRGESRIQSRQQSKMEHGWRPLSYPSELTRPPDRSRVSVGVGRSIAETKSAAVGPSVMGSWKEQRESKIHSRRQSQMDDDDWRMNSHPSQRETVSERAGRSKPGSKITARNSREPDTRLQEHNVFQPQGWLGTVETEDIPAFRTAAAATPGPSNRASRLTAPSGGLGSRVTKDASARSYN